MFYEWTEELSVGVPSIDKQHKVLIALINDLHDAIDAEMGASESRFILKKLVNYTKGHFIYEESLFTSLNYIDSEEHLSSHRNIEAKLSQFVNKSKDLNFDLPGDLMVFLKDWLTNHILQEDMRYSELLIKNKIK